MTMMKAAVFVSPGRIELQEKRIPDVGPNDALVRVTTTTICGTDVHILKGEYPVAPGLTIGHEPVGVIEKLGANVKGYTEGQRVIAGAICPSFTSYACQDGYPSQDGGCECHGYKPMGGWRFGNTIDGTQAEYVLVPDAQANLAPVPDGLTDEQVLMCPDIMSTGFAGAEAANIRIGDIVAIFAQGPIGLCATAGAKLRGASLIIGVDGIGERLTIARQMGADVTINFREVDPVAEILKITGGRGVDASIEALGLQSTFEAALRVLKPGGHPQCRGPAGSGGPPGGPDQAPGFLGITGDRRRAPRGPARDPASPPGPGLDHHLRRRPRRGGGGRLRLPPGRYRRDDPELRPRWRRHLRRR